MPDITNSEAYVTLVTNDSYALGALVLSQSLRNVGTTRQLVVMFTPGVSQEMRDQLLYAFDVMVQVDVLDSQDAVNLELLSRPDLGVTFTKLHCWRLTQFTKCVFMDADTMVLQNTDELFEREEFSAAPDVGWPDCFNSGVFVYRPSEETYASLLHFAVTHGSFDGGDQGLLNSYFSDWSTKDIKRHLPFVYNIVAHAFYSYLPALKQFGQSIKVVHFIGSVKPWSLGYNTATGEVEGYSSHAGEFVNRWWKVFMEKIHYRLDTSLASLVNVFERHPPPPPPPPSCEAPVWTLFPPLPVFENTTHQMTAPYVPPEVSVFYDPTPRPPVSEVPGIVAAPQSRPFFHFESFYTEPPMAQGESHPFMGEMYHAKEFSQVMTEFTHPPGPPPPPPLVEQAAVAADGKAKAETKAVVTKVKEQPVSEKPSADATHLAEATHVVTSVSDVGGSAAVTGKDATSGARAHVTEKDANLGAAKDSLEVTSEASSNLKIYTKQQLSDRERQFNWERGQIDYLGIDSFENILRQLEGTIKEPLFIESPPPPVTAPSPAVQSSTPRPHVQTSASGLSLDDVLTTESADKETASED